TELGPVEGQACRNFAIGIIPWGNSTVSRAMQDAAGLALDRTKLRIGASLADDCAGVTSRDRHHTDLTDGRAAGESARHDQKAQRTFQHSFSPAAWIVQNNADDRFPVFTDCFVRLADAPLGQNTIIERDYTRLNQEMDAVSSAHQPPINQNNI
ncbi:MAG: hypothetical protein AAFY56_17015, partial [Pseudomonadota bacterium]